ncbi:PucR family transcriptional regulator [Paeniglutamicibacter sp. ORCA_105]|uniref:PucR family transcriptional regulator n=1 Tax=Paeniglutamicibacter sp. ORCA_105 TaxID=3377336 RepID=UPI003895AC27
MNSTGRPLTLAGLLESLGAPLLTPLTGTRGLDASISVPVIHDHLDPLPDTPGGILLLVGMAPTHEDLDVLIARAAEHGFGAVVLKRRGTAPDAAQLATAALPVLVVDDQVPWLHLDNLIAAVTSGRPTGSNAASSHGEDLFVLANALATATDGAVAIEDLDQNILAYSNLERHTVDPLRRNGILARQVPEMEKNTAQYRAVMLTDSVVHFPYDPSDGELPRCAAPVRAGRQMLGSIWVIEDQAPLGPDGEAAILEVARLAAIHILRSQNAVDLERQVRTEWLRSALEGHGSDPATSARFGLMEGMSPVLLGFMFAPLPAGQVPGNALPLTRQLALAAEQYCSIFHPNVSAVESGSMVYVLVPAIGSEPAAMRLAGGAAAALAARLGCLVDVAVSSVEGSALGLADLRRELEDVVRVLEGRGPRQGTGRVVGTKDVNAALLLDQLESVLRSRPRLVHPGVRELLKNDAASGTEYRSSLCAYFAATGDVAAAARALNLHPNTLRYRIKRATELFGLDFSTGDEQLALWVQLRVATDPTA